MGSRLLTDPVMSFLKILVGQGGFEPPTPSLSGTYSNQLSYYPKLSIEKKPYSVTFSRGRIQLEMFL